MGIAILLMGTTSTQAQVTYVPEITDAIIASRTINVGKPVGATAGEHGVTATGAAAYSIPLLVPPGTNGMAPTLSLSYNSFAGDGLLGVGWGLGGLSSIQRVGADPYHDGTTAPVKFSNADYFALDGQRLVNTYGSYHASNAVYDTENAQFAFITREGSYGSGPAGFKVIFKNGMTYWYGFVDSGSNSSLALRSSGGEALAWLLSKTEDPFGNMVRYTYSNNDPSEAKRIVSIQYTINEAQNITAYNSIDFIYNARSDKNISYHSGSTIKSDFLLERIDINTEGTLTKQYELRYSSRQQQVSYLTELIERGHGGSELNSTIFKYGDLLATQESLTITTPVGQNETCDLFYGDFDGNGISDS